MKANQAFRTEEEAVSPVVGVILMVAITVVLAAVVFVLVQGLGQGADKAPEVGFNVDNTDRSVTIVKAPAGGDTMQYGPAAEMAIGGTCTFVITGANGVVKAYDGTADVAANDVIDGCAAGETLTFTHVPTNTAFREPITFP